MRFYQTLLAATFALRANCEQFEIPEVASLVNDILLQYDNTVHYEGNDTVASGIQGRAATSFWMEGISHQGVSAFGTAGYQIFRNVHDYGAKGDGVTDDTAAINAAMNAGGRCGQSCSSSTVSPAVVYFPSGTYLLSSSILDQYYTQIIGNPNDPPTLKATAGFTGFGLIDGDKYYTANLNWGSTNVFFRQVRNFIFDTTAVPITSSLAAIHWPTAQATSLQNLVFQMSTAAGTQHVGIFCESGSAGFMNDLTFNGGHLGLQVGNQQFTMRNIVFNNVNTAISQLWSWGWLYQGLTINNCQIGIDISAHSRTDQQIGSVQIIDSTVTNTLVFVLTAFDSSSKPDTAGSLILENIVLSNVGTAVQQSGTSGTILAGTGGSLTIAAWGQGHEYVPAGPTRFQGGYTPPTRPASLLNGNVYYSRSKPQYNNQPVTQFLSVRTAGATGNGNTDDTTALQNVINSAASSGKIVYIDAGTYKVTSTLYIPPGSKIVGETYPIIMSSGPYFNDINNPRPVVRVGNAGQAGQVEWSDAIVSTQGQQAGAIAIEWNLAASGTPSGMWDVHVRIGGFAGSDLQVAQCSKTPGNPTINQACIGAYMLMHITPSASGLYMENVWLWTADHDIDSTNNDQLTIYSARGLYIESTSGNFWLVGTAVEHNTLYQYQLANTQNIFMGFIQTETPYYQPNPIAPAPFSIVSSLNDPDFATSCVGASGNCAASWGLRILNSHDVLIYGAGLYSFFQDYSTTCSNTGGPENCQSSILSLEGSLANINIYTLATVGATNMITENGKSLAVYSNNINVFPQNIARFQTGVVTGPKNPPPATTTTTTTASASATPCLPPPSSLGLLGWNYRGCYTDSISARTLGTLAQVPGGAQAMTIEACITTCSAAGFTLAGVEFSGECYCDNALENSPLPASSGCNMPCNGSPSETCGGANRISLYSYLTCNSIALGAGSQWNFKGCYTDSVSARILSFSVPGIANAAMTVEKCLAACKGLGYAISGVEFGGECYCDSVIRNGGAPAVDGNAKCNMPCGGNQAEVCGGPDRLDLYTYGS